MAEQAEIPNTHASPNTLNEKSAEIPTNDTATTLALPPIDTGFKAWSFCFSACMLETLIFGWNDTIGTFQAYYVSHAPYNQSSTAAASAIGTSSQAIQYIEAAILVWVFQRYPRAVKPAMWAGLIVCTGTLLASSFTNRVWQLILTQGVFYGFAAAPLITAVYMWLPEWFVAKRGLAGGIIFGFSGVGGFVMPLIIGLALDRYGMNWTLRVWAIVFAVCGGLAVFGTRPRIPIPQELPNPSDDESRSPFLEKKYIIRLLRNPLMILMSAATFFQSIGYFPVSYYVSTYSLYIPRSSVVDSTITLGLLNISSAVTYAGFGKICDFYPYPRIILWSSLAATLSAALLWGFASKVAILFVFALLYGGASNGFPGVWAAAATEIGESTDKGTSLAFGVLSFAKGIAVVVGPLIADALHGRDNRTLQQYGSFGFTGVIIYVASMSAATGLTAIPLLFLSHANRSPSQ